jgi:hypothetical protein
MHQNLKLALMVAAMLIAKLAGALWTMGHSVPRTAPKAMVLLAPQMDPQLLA